MSDSMSDAPTGEQLLHLGGVRTAAAEGAMGSTHDPSTGATIAVVARAGGCDGQGPRPDHPRIG